MASIFIGTGLSTYIDYSLVDGRIRVFELNSVLLYDEDDYVSVKGWEDKLITLIKEQGLDKDTGSGIYLFVNKLLQEGKI